MYDVEKLVSLVCELFDAEAEGKKYNLEVRKNKGYSPDAYLWVSTLGGSEAYRLGELAERSRQIVWSLATVCDMLDINQDWLIAAVKSMLRKERHNGRWDNPNLTCWMGREDKERLRRFLSNKRGEFDYHPWYSSTGRKKAWCE